MTHEVDDVAEGAEELAAVRIGRRVHDLRAERSWTTRELALRVGVSQGMVTEIEEGRRVPTIATLYRLTDAFGVAPGEVLPDADAEPRTEVHLPLSDDPDSPTARVIGGAGESTQTYLFEVRPGEEDGAVHTHPGDELLVVMDGAVLSCVAGRAPVEVPAGSSLLVDPTTPHHYRVAGSALARFLLICTVDEVAGRLSPG